MLAVLRHLIQHGNGDVAFILGAAGALMHDLAEHCVQNFGEGTGGEHGMR